MNKKTKAVTLLEMIIVIVLMFLLVLGFYSVGSFSRHHVADSDKRAKIQNELSYALEHMAKYVQAGTGNSASLAIQLYNHGSAPAGFKVRVDSLQTPEDLEDDTTMNYYLDGNTLYAGIEGSDPEVLSDKILTNFSTGIMPDVPLAGFYVDINPSGTAVEVGLVGRDKPTEDAGIDNPQVVMKTKLFSGSASAN